MSLVLQLGKSSVAQRKFWTSKAKFRLFSGGVGSGKTFAGVVECLKMPAGSTGIVVAPNFRILKDATKAEFDKIARSFDMLKTSTRGADPWALLKNGTKVLFRSADRGDYQIGTNIDWFWIDEGAFCDKDIWMSMIARCRVGVQRGWITTTPRGFNWVYTKFVKNQKSQDKKKYETFYCSTEDNVGLPNTAEYVETLRENYSGLFARQQIGGEFIDTSGAIFRRSWFKERVDAAPPDLRWVRYYDLAASVSDRASKTATAACALDHSSGKLYIRDVFADKIEWPEQMELILELAAREPGVIHGIEEKLHGGPTLQMLHREPRMSGVAFTGVPVQADKIVRSMNWSARAEAGKVVLVNGPWNEDFLCDVEQFDGSRDTPSDIVDCVSGCMHMMQVVHRAIGGFVSTPALTRIRQKIQGRAPALKARKRDRLWS